MSVEKEIITLLTRAARATASLAEKSLVFAHYSLEYSEQQEHLKQQREVSAHLRRSVSQFESMEQSAEAHVVVAAEEAAAAAEGEEEEKELGRHVRAARARIAARCLLSVYVRTGTLNPNP